MLSLIYVNSWIMRVGCNLKNDLHPVMFKKKKKIE